MVLVGLSSEWTGRKWSKVIEALFSQSIPVLSSCGECGGCSCKLCCVPDHDSALDDSNSPGNQVPKVGNTPNLLAHFTHCGQGGWSPHLVSTCKQTSPHISSSHPEQDSDQVTIEQQLTRTLLVGAVRSAQGEGEDTIWPPPPYTTRMAIRCPLLLSHIYPSLYLSAVPGTIAYRSKGFQGINNSWRLLSLVLVPRPGCS